MGRRRGPALSREQVIDAAIRCIERDGPEALGVSRVARELGIKPPSLYNHIDKGDDLARAVFVEGNRRMLEHLKDAVRGVVPPEEQLLTLALSLRRWARAHAGLYAVMSQIEPDNDHPEFRALMVDLFDLFFRPLAQLGVAEADHLHALRGLRAAMHGFVLLENSGQYALSTAPEESYRWLIAGLLRGLRSADPP